MVAVVVLSAFNIFGGNVATFNLVVLVDDKGAAELGGAGIEREIGVDDAAGIGTTVSDEENFGAQFFFAVTTL